MAPNSSSRIRSLGSADLERCMAMSTQANWNQTVHDWEYLFEHALTYGVELPDLGLIGTTVAWPISSQHAWINMVLVDESCRGQGLAKTMFERCLDDLKTKGMISFLDATEMGSRVYRKFGFFESTELVRMKGRAEPLREIKPAADTVIALSNEAAAEVISRDEQVLGGNRGSFFKRLINDRPELSRCHLGTDGRVDGFVTGRVGRVATQIGPVIAEDFATARALISAAAKSVTDEVYIDVPTAAVELVDWLTDRGFTVERSFLRMGLDGAELATDWSHYYAIAGPDYA